MYVYVYMYIYIYIYTNKTYIYIYIYILIYIYIWYNFSQGYSPSPPMGDPNRRIRQQSRLEVTFKALTSDVFFWSPISDPPNLGDRWDIHVACYRHPSKPQFLRIIQPPQRGWMASSRRGVTHKHAWACGSTSVHACDRLNTWSVHWLKPEERVRERERERDIEIER